MSEMDDIEIQRDPPIPEEVEFSCASCRYWHDEANEYDPRGDGDYGFCRRYAPRSKSFRVEDDGKYAVRGHWPVTRFDECCGEWKE